MGLKINIIIMIMNTHDLTIIMNSLGPIVSTLHF